MIYFLNNNIENKKKVSVALAEIFGLGKRGCTDICDLVGISENIRICHLSGRQLDLLGAVIEENYSIGLDLKSLLRREIERYKQISAYRGIRHAQGLPCRGQRTHTNGKTVRALTRPVVVKGESTAQRVRGSRGKSSKLSSPSTRKK
jgi:small subunit ribosomal protein S13